MSLEKDPNSGIILGRCSLKYMCNFPEQCFEINKRATIFFPLILSLGIEFLTIKQRGLLGNALYITGGVIDAYMALAAYLLRDWQDLLLAVSWPTLCAFIFCWYVLLCIVVGGGVTFGVT